MRLSAALASSSLGGKVFLTNSGDRGDRGGDQARPPRSPGRHGLVVLQDAFHGRTYGALSATPQESKQAPFAPLVPGFVVVPKDPDALERAVDEQTAAVLLEPIQGESGINVLSDELLAAAREACDRTGAALVFDEIQTGMGRTGTLWAYEQTASCPMRSRPPRHSAAGLPIGALVTGERLAECSAARRPRLDVRRRPGDRERGARGARDLLGSRTAGERADRSGNGSRPAWAQLSYVASRSRPGPDARDRSASTGCSRPSWRAGRCSSNGWSSTPRGPRRSASSRR